MFEVNEKNVRSYARNLSIATAILIILLLLSNLNLFSLILIVAGVIMIYGLNKKDLSRYKIFFYIIYGFSILIVAYFIFIAILFIIGVIMAKGISGYTLLGLIFFILYFVIYSFYAIALHKFLQYIRSTEKRSNNQPENMV